MRKLYQEGEREFAQYTGTLEEAETAEGEVEPVALGEAQAVLVAGEEVVEEVAVQLESAEQAVLVEAAAAPVQVRVRARVRARARVPDRASCSLV